MDIEELIKEGEKYGATMTKSPVPSNIIGIGNWEYGLPDSVGYWAWTKKCVIFLRQNGNVEESKELKKYAEEKASWQLKDSFEQMMSILKAVKEFSSKNTFEYKDRRSFDEKKVFIVHGHDSNTRNEAELLVKQLGFEPVVLFKKPNMGDTIIEKLLRESSEAAFAIVLYTKCDEGKAADDIVLKPRARQNVVFEHGLMCGLLGRKNVVALVEEGVEIPGDLSGVVYITLDAAKRWQFDVAREMKACGLHVDLNNLM